MKIFTPKAAIFSALASFFLALLLIQQQAQSSTSIAVVFADTRFRRVEAQDLVGNEVEYLRSKKRRSKRAVQEPDDKHLPHHHEDIQGVPDVTEANNHHDNHHINDAEDHHEEDPPPIPNKESRAGAAELDAIKKDEDDFDSQGPAFFAPASSSTSSASSCPKTLASSSIFFSQLAKSEHVLCHNLHPADKHFIQMLNEADPGAKTKSRKLTEYTASFVNASPSSSSPTTVSFHEFENLAVPIENGIRSLKYFTCQEGTEVELTNVDGKKTRPSWFTLQSDYDNEKNKKSSDHIDHEEAKIEQLVKPVFRVRRSRPGNVLENFETLFNIYMATKSLPTFKNRQQQQQQGDENAGFRIIFKDYDSTGGGQQQGSALQVNPRDTLRWSDVGMFRPIVADPMKDLIFEDNWHEIKKNYQAKNKDLVAIFEFPTLIEFNSFPLTAVSSSSSSSSSSSTLCPSQIFQEFVVWFYKKNGVDHKSQPREHSDRKLRVLWASRGPSRDRFKDKTMKLPKRRLRDEIQFSIDLADELGEGIDLQVIEFGEQTVASSLTPVRDADVLVGIHGAALTWAAFLSPGTTALVEVFTHDLLQGGGDFIIENVSPYRKIAAWNDIQYASVKLEDTKYVDGPFTIPFEGEQQELWWNENHVKKIADAIKEKLPFKKKVMDKFRWCT